MWCVVLQSSTCVDFDARILPTSTADVWKTGVFRPLSAFGVHPVDLPWCKRLQCHSLISNTEDFRHFPPALPYPPGFSWILAELRSESRSPPRRGPPKESLAANRRQLAPSADFRARAGKRGLRRRRRMGVEDASLDSTSGSEPSGGSRSPSAAVLCQDKEEGAGGRLPPRDGRRVKSARGWAGGVPENGMGRRLSTRSADGTPEGAMGDAAILRGSTRSGGSARSTMGAR